MHLGSAPMAEPAERTIDQATPLGPRQVRVILAADAFDRRSSIADEAERYLSQVYFRDRAFDEVSDAELAYQEEEPTPPEACREVDVTTGRSRMMSREEMMELAGSDFGGSGALWLERVLAFDRWRLECLQVEMRHKLPQLRARADSASANATKVAWCVLDKPAITTKDVAVKLGVFMLEIGEVELREEDAKPLRQLCGELLAMVSAASAG